MYLHYCGGELEKVSYIIKDTSGCCDSDEAEEPVEDDCCKNENLVLKNITKFTLQQNVDFDFSKNFTQTLFHSFTLFIKPIIFNHSIKIQSIKAPPPKLLASLVISTSVIRI